MHSLLDVVDAGKALAGISQRDHANFYEHLTRATTRERIEDAIVDFFVAHVRREFAVDPNYIFDVYVDKAFRVWILDFGPFSFVTDSLLFSHLRDFAPLLRAQRAGLPLPSTLATEASPAAVSFSSSSSDAMTSASLPSTSPPPAALPNASAAASAQQWFEFEFRIVESQQSVVPSNTMHYRLPKEIIELSDI